MTNGDFLRGLDDIGLAQALYQIINTRDVIIWESLKEQGVDADLVTIPSLGIMHHLKFVQAEYDPPEEGENT